MSNPTQNTIADTHEHLIFSATDPMEFKQKIESHLNDGTGWSFAGWVSITVQDEAIHYAQALSRVKPFLGETI